MEPSELADRHLHPIDDEVFADEIDALIARREVVAGRPNPGGQSAPRTAGGSAADLRRAVVAQSGGSPRPSPELGLVGLCLSGGGIRSATFNLGVIQVLAKRGLLRWIDYLSTVSGGGYIGSALSSALLFETENEENGGKQAPLGASFVHQTGRPETALIKHLRNGRDYLAPNGLRDTVRIPAVLLRGIIINLLIVVPIIGSLAIITALAPPFGVFFYDFELLGFAAEQLGRGDVALKDVAGFFLFTLLAVVLFVAWSAIFPLIARLFPRASWVQRDRFERTFAGALLLVASVGVVNLLPYLYYILFNGEVAESPPWQVAAAAVAVIVPIATSLRSSSHHECGTNRNTDRLKLIAVALLGPLILVSMYLGMTHWVLTPLTYPFGDTSSPLNLAARALPDELRRDTRAILDEGEPTPYQRWAGEGFDRYLARPGAVPAMRNRPYHQFIEAAMAQSDDELTASVRAWRDKFQPALRLRGTPLGMALFGDNRLLEPLRRNLGVEPPRRNLAVEPPRRDPAAEPPRAVPPAPQTGAPATTVTASDLLSGDDLGPQRVGRLAQAAAALRRDIVLIRSAALFLFGALVVLYIMLLVNINRTGLHRFYRDRLSKAYLFDPQDPAGGGGRADRLKLTDIDPQHAGNPYHLVNAALNVPATDIADLQGRRTDFFAMAPRWCGSSAMEFRPTRAYEDDYDRDINLGTAFAISGAAAAPQMGVNSSPPLALVMSLLNIRLDYWLPNLKILKDGARPPSRGPGPGYLLREISGRMTDETPFVNLSDGGHIENLGLYELLRRRCKYIICCDAEQDPDMILSGLGKLTAYARMDEGIWIDWGGTLRKLRLNPDTGYSRAHWAVGTIHYGDGETGRIVYLKSSMCGDEFPDMLAYRAQNPEFPQESTGDQFFDEQQFEAYRGLGYLIADQLFDDGASEVANLDDWFETLACIPEIKT